jgi:hypothetical protein
VLGHSTRDHHLLRLGTQKPLLRSHTNAAGFDHAFTHILTEASALT